MIAIIGGTSVLDTGLFRSWPQKRVETPYGPVALKEQGKVVFLQRHGEPAVPPHRINHRANIWALKRLGTERIIAINSVGSLKISIRPGAFLIPDDFISIWQIATFFDDTMRFMIPKMDQGLAQELGRNCTKLNIAVRLGGTYVQTMGPRLETRAEIRMLERFGDVVGMTMASEATLSMEQEIPYVSLCSVDNYCNGIVEVPLTLADIQRNVALNVKRLEILTDMVLAEGCR
jgi:5'-methylthioadenosine phosphorylase